MKRILIVVVCVLFVAAVVGMVVAADKSKVYYVCNCKDDCKCNTISKEPGKCKCGTELTAMHVLATEKDTAVFCRCGADCTCERSKTDASQCGCGKPVKVVSLKGKYACACGANCQCGAISDKPGKCGCGKDMKQVI
jgi:hypothetical protein